MMAKENKTNEDKKKKKKTEKAFHFTISPQSLVHSNRSTKRIIHDNSFNPK